jgi:hypothetical protein
LKPEWWGSPLAQEQKYQGRKKTCDNDDDDDDDNFVEKSVRFGVAFAGRKTTVHRPVTTFL